MVVVAACGSSVPCPAPSALPAGDSGRDNEIIAARCRAEDWPKAAKECLQAAGRDERAVTACFGKLTVDRGEALTDELSNAAAAARLRSDLRKLGASSECKNLGPALDAVADGYLQCGKQSPLRAYGYSEEAKVYVARELDCGDAERALRKLADGAKKCE